MQRGSLWGIERWCWNWGFIPASDVGFKFLWSREGTGQPQVPPSCFRLVSNKVRCTMQESGEEGGRRQTSCLRVTGEPEGGRGETGHELWTSTRPPFHLAPAPPEQGQSILETLLLVVGVLMWKQICEGFHLPQKLIPVSEEIGKYRLVYFKGNEWKNKDI